MERTIVFAYRHDSLHFGQCCLLFRRFARGYFVVQADCCRSVFGTGGAARALNVLICLSAFGNLVAVLINASRLLRETGRLVSSTRVFPFPRTAFSSNLSMFIDKVSFLSQSSGPIQNHSERL